MKLTAKVFHRKYFKRIILFLNIYYMGKTKYADNHYKSPFLVTKLFGHDIHISYMNHNRVDTLALINQLGTAI